MNNCNQELKAFQDSATAIFLSRELTKHRVSRNPWDSVFVSANLLGMEMMMVLQGHSQASMLALALASVGVMKNSD